MLGTHPLLGIEPYHPVLKKLIGDFSQDNLGTLMLVLDHFNLLLEGLFVSFEFLTHRVVWVLDEVLPLVYVRDV
jgi:hypothetical protein